MTNPLQSLPPRARYYLYLALALTGVFFGAAEVYGVTAVGPVAVDRALKVVAYLGTALGVLAASNTPKGGDA